ncbi:MAG: hypothetical protein HYV65_00605 [Candidatus Spechtbacteria bacterium]|nr:hypothetical protein [Candidatus Spechtbacteria bacterium]
MAGDKKGPRRRDFSDDEEEGGEDRTAERALRDGRKSRGQRSNGNSRDQGREEERFKMTSPATTADQLEALKANGIGGNAHTDEVVDCPRCGSGKKDASFLQCYRCHVEYLSARSANVAANASAIEALMFGGKAFMAYPEAEAEARKTNLFPATEEAWVRSQIDMAAIRADLATAQDAHAATRALVDAEVQRLTGGKRVPDKDLFQRIVTRARNSVPGSQTNYEAMRQQERRFVAAMAFITAAPSVDAVTEATATAPADPTAEDTTPA